MTDLNPTQLPDCGFSQSTALVPHRGDNTASVPGWAGIECYAQQARCSPFFWAGPWQEGDREAAEAAWVGYEGAQSFIQPCQAWSFCVSEKEVALEKVWNKPFAFTRRKFAHMFVPLSLLTEGFTVMWGGH